MRGNELKAGMVVKHSGSWWEILEVRKQGPIITCIAPCGGRMSFWSDSKVEVKP